MNGSFLTDLTKRPAIRLLLTGAGLFTAAQCRAGLIGLIGMSHSIAKHCLGRLRCLLVIITQEPTQPLTALHGPLAADLRVTREQQDVALPLVISLGMVMLNILDQRPPKRALAK